MEQAQNISVTQCCLHYSIETSFVEELHHYGLIELTQSSGESFISYEQLADLEKYMHLHYDLDINMAGMETISHLLARVQQLQHELRKLRADMLTEE
jgi:hypothetical protein